ncbi:hypothetical protein A4D02_03215 [Niastella koreensis]|uniref:Uncharacterized protein n=1 Tax=Niastella koreensis TaxID=354356 RepID=A0ABX3P591_9BACT|nr:hypothetical protein A4D02_03215 [Niastella koreensis]
MIKKKPFWRFNRTWKKRGIPEHKPQVTGFQVPGSRYPGNWKTGQHVTAPRHFFLHQPLITICYNRNGLLFIRFKLKKE